MAGLVERLRRLEASVSLRVSEMWDEETRRRFGRWPEIVLQRYCEGRLDALAQELEPLHKLLDVPAKHGYAVQQGGSWHPLYRVKDECLNEALVQRLNAFDVEPPVCA